MGTSTKRPHESDSFFLAGLDRFNRAVQAAGDPDAMLDAALAEILEIFGCDRAYVANPCDPAAPTLFVRFERFRPGFPGAHAEGIELPMSEELADHFGVSLRSPEEPLRFGPGGEHPLPPGIADRFQIRALLAVALYAGETRACQFGIHQCSRDRVWRPEEVRLFAELGRRLADVLVKRRFHHELLDASAVVENSASVLVRRRCVGGLPIEYVSRNVREQLGYDAPALTSRSARFVDLVAEEDRSRVVGEIEAHLAAGRDRFSQEYRLVADDGRVRWIEERTWVRRDADGTPGWIEGIIVDQTARKRDEEALRRAKDAADAANAAKTRFLRVMSHELRTPLNAIMGMNDLLGGAASPELRRDYLDTQLRACKGLMAMIDDVLTLSEEEILGAEARHATAPFELEELLRSVIDSFELAARDKGLDLRVQRGDGLPRSVCGDLPRLRQILINLVGNAVKFTERGGVTIGVRCCGRGAERLAFAIQDTGIGIAEVDRREVFRPFAQVDASAARQHGGAGLGLAIASTMVGQLGGELRVESALGEGSCFSFDVPLRSEIAIARRDGAR